MKKFNKILVTGFSRENLDENVWAKIEGLTEKLIFEPENNVDCLFSRFNKVDKQLELISKPPLAQSAYRQC